MKRFEYEPLEFGAGIKAIGEFNDFVTLHAGIIDFVKKYEDQIDVLEKHLSEKDCEKLYYAITVVPKTIAELAPIVEKEFSKEEGPEYGLFFFVLKSRLLMEGKGIGNDLEWCKFGSTPLGGDI